ncbi:MAG: hypothetical protein U0263_16080 [Polyangiaceae bacterium]
MAREVFFLIGRGGALLHCDASSSPNALPDSRRRWEVIWEHRQELEELAHSHPHGPLAFSQEDETTMLALESALGKTLRFSVVAPDGTLRREGATTTRIEREHEAWWAELLRLASGMNPKPGEE